MKQHNQVLLYDDYCPLCSWYSGLFVKYGLLQSENRVAFSTADLEVLTAIDIEKAKDEIPLFDKDKRTTLYGIDSLLEILSWKLPLVKKVGTIKPLNWLLRKFYKFISYNRKVIVAKKCGNGVFDCSPYFSFRYRVLFMLVFFIFNTLMLIPLHEQFFSKLSFYHLSLAQLQLAHLGLVVSNCMIAAFLGSKNAVEYLGQVNMLALISILWLLPLMMWHQFFVPGDNFSVAYLGVLTAFIVKEYFRRMKYANVFAKHKPVIFINLACITCYLLYVFH
jgi:hypothetical protein